jgi:hypothetical protein
MKGKVFLFLILVLLLAGASYLAAASGCKGDYRNRTDCHFITDENGEGRVQSCGSGFCIVNRYNPSNPPPNVYALCNCQ